MSSWDEDAANIAAEQAGDELEVMWTYEQLAQWFYKYYLACGYKRLGRIITATAKEMGILEDVQQKKQSDYQP